MKILITVLLLGMLLSQGCTQLTPDPNKTVNVIRLSNGTVYEYNYYGKVVNTFQTEPDKEVIEEELLKVLMENQYSSGYFEGCLNFCYNVSQDNYSNPNPEGNRHFSCVNKCREITEAK